MSNWKDWKNIYQGLCPNCAAGLRETVYGYVACEKTCGFIMNTSKLYARIRRSQGYYRIKNRSRTEEEKMDDIMSL